MATIRNASNYPLFDRAGTVPDVSGALLDTFQPMTFDLLTKTPTGFQVVETTEPISFRGFIQPFTDRKLAMLPEGQRSWTWLELHAESVLTLQTDDVVLYKGVQTRVMTRKDFSLYGYVHYTLVQDWEGSGP